MFWVYFARDFYRAGSQPVSSTKVSAEPKPIYQSILPHAYAVRSGQVTTVVFEQMSKNKSVMEKQPAATSESRAFSPSAWLQRLSIEGDHAFGIWDTESGFSVFSANFERVTGLTSSECAGHDWIHTIHTDHQYAVNEALLQAGEGLDQRCLVRVCSIHAEESWRWLMLDIKAATQKQPYIMVLWQDMTEQKALEETLMQVENALAMSDRGRSAFLSSMSHELRTPLNAIMGFSEMMKSGVFGPLENPTYREYATHIHDSGSLLLNKVNDLLDIASMDAGGLELDETQFFLPELLAEAIEMHSHQAFRRNQQLKLDCPHALTLRADRAKLLCSIAHLITNALRHSADGAEIRLSVSIQQDDGVIVTVRDSGEGISPAQLETIRNALNAEVAYFNIESGGVGLGLSLAKELTSRHGGRVMIDSVRRRGTVVSLILPMERVLSGLPVKRRSQLQPV